MSKLFALPSSTRRKVRDLLLLLPANPILPHDSIRVVQQKKARGELKEILEQYPANHRAFIEKENLYNAEHLHTIEIFLDKQEEIERELLDFVKEVDRNLL